MTRKEKATDLFMKGFNCSQSVFTAFCDKFDLDETTALKISAGLGGGVGRQREVCGAVSGAAMVLGSICAGVEADETENKEKNYALVTEFCEKFKSRHNTIICHELLEDTNANMFGTKPDARTREYYRDRPCLRLIESSVEILEEFFAQDV